MRKSLPLLPRRRVGRDARRGDMAAAREREKGTPFLQGRRKTIFF